MNTMSMSSCSNVGASSNFVQYSYDISAAVSTPHHKSLYAGKAVGDFNDNGPNQWKEPAPDVSLFISFLPVNNHIRYLFALRW